MELQYKITIRKYFKYLFIITIINALLFVIFNYYSFSQDKSIQYIPVEFYEKRLGKAEVEIILKDNKAYIPFSQLCNLLRIKIEISPDKNIFSGYLIDPDSVYSVSTKNKIATYRNKKIEYNDVDVIITEKDYYFVEEFYHELFGLQFKYDDKKLQINLKSKLSFPELRQRRRQKAFQREISREQIQPSMDYGRSPSVFHLGKLNYVLTTTKLERKDLLHKYNFNFGGQLLWGDFETSVKGVFQKPIRERDIYGQIRYPFFNSKIINQIIIGDIRKKSFIGGSILGVDVSNIPAERRIRFGEASIVTKVPESSEYYSSNRNTKPVYFYTQKETTITQKIPLYFGINEFTGRNYDWFGVENKYVDYFVIPPGLIPPGKIDYRLTLGKMRRHLYPVYSSADIQYGATDRISLGAGIEYSNVKNNKTKIFPYTYSTVRFFNNIYGTLEFSPFILSQMSLTMQTYDHKIINFQYNFRQSSPLFNPRGIKNTMNIYTQYPILFKYGNINIGGRYTNNILRDGTESNYTFNFASAMRNISATYSLNQNYSKYNFKYRIFRQDAYFDTSVSNITRNLYSTVDFAIRATSYSVITTGGMYNHYENKLNFIRLGLVFPIFSAVTFSFVAERNFLTRDLLAVVNINIRPKFFNSNTTAMKNKSGYYLSERLSGEILASTQTFDVMFQNKTHDRQGYFMTSAFLDTNRNGKRDKGEYFLKDVNFTLGRKEGFGDAFTKKYDNYRSISYGEYYRDYMVSVKPHTLEDPLFVPLYDRINIKAEPNIIKSIEIPIVTGGIVNGSVTGADGNPVSGVMVILQGPKKLKKTTYTGSNGEYEFSTIPPGDYAVNIDEEILKQSRLVSEPFHEIIVITGEPGQDFITVDFMLKEL